MELVRTKGAHDSNIMEEPKKLIDKHKVKAILGGYTWEEASVMAEVISEADHDIPVFLSVAVPTQSTHMNAIAAILQSLGIRQVTIIYETSSSASIISHFSRAFRRTGGELTLILPLTSGSSSLDEELEVLKKQQSKVFVIHTSMELGVRLFQVAKKLEMTGDGYIWIASNGITDLFHSIDPIVISSINGMVGVKTYFPKNTPEIQTFRKLFRQKFHSYYPEEEQDEPGIFAVQGYNAVKLLEENSPKNFDCRRPVPATTVEIVYVIGKGYHSVYWTEGLGFSETVEDGINGAANYTHPMDDVGKSLWPEQPWYANSLHLNRMSIDLPGTSLLKQLVSVEINPETNEDVFYGFAVKVFDEMSKKMNQLYDLITPLLEYHDLIEAIQAGMLDAVVGDVTIIPRRHNFVKFIQPITESGIVTIVPIRPRLSNRAWLFMKPFTSSMWWFIAGITIYNGFVIWLIERSYNEDLRGSVMAQIGVIIWLAFATLFTLRGGKLHSNLSRMVVVMWFFVTLIIIQSYTASLASMLTAQRTEPTITSVEMHRNMNATIGYCKGSFLSDYLTDILGFDAIRINNYSSTHEYAEALYSGEIAAIFFEVPSAKVFLAQYCNSFFKTKETFKVGGFGFAFHKGFQRLSDANVALMNISESGKLKQLEDRYMVDQKCVDEESSPDKDESLSVHSFWVLFLLTGGTSTLAITISISIREFRRRSNQQHINFIILVLAFIRYWQHKMRRSPNIVVNVGNSRHTRNIERKGSR